MFGREKKSEKPQLPERSSTEDIAVAGTTPAHGEANAFSEGGKNYRNMGRGSTALVLITNQVGMGILSLPAQLQVLGIVPGVITIVGLGLLSTYTAYELLQFYRRYPHVVNVVDMAKVVGGKPLEIVVAIGMMIKLCLSCASATVTLSVAFNSISDHAICTVGWIGISAIVCWLLCLPRQFKFVAHIGIPSTVSIFAAIMIVIISLGVADPKGVPPEGWEKEVKVVGNPTFREGLNSCLQICYAYAGNIGFVSYMAEMRDPSRDFVWGLAALQAFSIPLYLLVAIAIYCLSGQYVASPALGSAPQIPAKIAYGIVLPALFGTGLVFGHTAVKFLYVVSMRALKSTHQMTDNSAKSWGVWVGSATAFWIVAFVIANAVPIFDSILSISSATFVAWFTFGISAVFWFFLNKGRYFSTPTKIALSVVNALIIIQALFMNGAGLWTAITGLMEIFDGEGGIEGSFTCADNSIF